MFDGAILLNVAGPAEAFSLANRELARRAGTNDLADTYEILLVSPDGGPVATTAGVEISARALADVGPGTFDTLAVVGGMTVRALARNRELVAWVRAAADRATRLAAFGSGTFLLASAGLLNGRRCAAHWRVASALRSQYPLIDFDTEALFVQDGRFLTAAGSTSSIDLALSMVRDDHGEAIASTVAQVLVLPRVRPGEDPQLSIELRAQAAANPKVAAAAEWITRNIATRPSVTAVADRFAMSERNFSRTFKREMGISPQRFIEAARVESARRWLSGPSLPIETVARRAGYSSAEHLARAFRSAMGMAPSAFRDSVRVAAARNAVARESDARSGG